MVNVPFEEHRPPRKPDKKLQNRDFSMQGVQKFNPKTDKRHFVRNFNKNEAMAAAEPHTSGNTAVEGPTVIDTSTAPPIVAIVTPTTRPPPITGNNSNNANCKSGNIAATIIPQGQQQQQQPTLMHTTYRIQGVPHHHLGPIQLTATALSPPPPMQQATTSGVQMGQPGTTTACWPIVEPIFHFGQGFELHHSYCPTHSQPSPSEHVVLFHLLPGVAVSFQIGGSRKIIRGESLFLVDFSN